MLSICSSFFSIILYIFIIVSFNIFISYSEDGLLPIEDLLTFLRQYGNVELSEIRYKRFRSNNSKKGLELTEYLIYLQKNERV